MLEKREDIKFPKIVGYGDDVQLISRGRYAVFAEQVLEHLRPGKVTICDFSGLLISEFNKYRCRVYSMAQGRFGEGGHVGMKRDGNTLYVWLTHPELSREKLRQWNEAMEAWV